MNCDTCGKGGQLFDADIEGTVLVVCTDCAKFGKVLRKHSTKDNFTQKFVETKKKVVESEPQKIIVSNYSSIIKKAREKMGLNQEDFAKLLQEKVSLIQHWESGKMEPSILVAEKIEKQLKIKLVDVYRDDLTLETKEARGPLTIGDIIKLRKK